MRASEQAYDLIRSEEGLRLKTYKDPVGKLTIGYGHTRNAKPDMEITLEQAEELLTQDVKSAERIVNWYVRKVNQNQFDALVSFVFNVGSGHFKGSTLLRKVKVNPDDPSIADEFAKWIRGGGKVLPGLVRRRKREAELYFK